jgi:hypothetical protein
MSVGAWLRIRGRVKSAPQNQKVLGNPGQSGKPPSSTRRALSGMSTS